ncbi:MAG: hypothetical protein JWR32_4195 [Mycobacterium sp.]|jgi:hypothetical protein|nr:hypothetical protein [Mycobacterium sp.]
MHSTGVHLTNAQNTGLGLPEAATANEKYCVAEQLAISTVVQCSIATSRLVHELSLADTSGRKLSTTFAWRGQSGILPQRVTILGVEFYDHRLLIRAGC